MVYHLINPLKSFFIQEILLHMYFSFNQILHPIHLNFIMLMLLNNLHIMMNTNKIIIFLNHLLFQIHIHHLIMSIFLIHLMY